MLLLPCLLVAATAPRIQSQDVALAPPPAYDFSAAEAHLDAELPRVGGDLCVIARQSGREVFRYSRGAIGPGTLTRMASFTKTVSAAVVLDLVEDGTLALDERIGDSFPLLFDANGIGDPTVLDCWAMRHGIGTPQPFHRDPTLTHGESVLRIGALGFERFPASAALGYDGAGMQVTAFIAAQRTGLPWEALARERLFDPLRMPRSDYAQFAPNPAVAGGLRTTPLEAMRFADMVMAGGVERGVRVLEPSSIEVLFTSHTAGLPVDFTPFPASHPDYPYGVAPDYAFGGWAFAVHPTTGHVEEIVGAGAWGSYIWLDRRRGLTAVVFADVPPGTQVSMDAALGFFREARAAVEARQVRDLHAAPSAAGRIALSWTLPPGSGGAVVVGSDEPIQDVFDLRASVRIGGFRGESADVPAFDHYAVMARIGPGLNGALVPGQNTLSR